MGSSLQGSFRVLDPPDRPKVGVACLSGAQGSLVVVCRLLCVVCCFDGLEMCCWCRRNAAKKESEVGRRHGRGKCCGGVGGAGEAGGRRANGASGNARGKPTTLTPASAQTPSEAREAGRDPTPVAFVLPTSERREALPTAVAARSPTWKTNVAQGEDQHRQGQHPSEEHNIPRTSRPREKPPEGLGRLVDTSLSLY